MAVVGLPPSPLAHEAGALRMLDRALVEAVDLELEPVVAEVVDEVALEDPGGLVGDPAAAVVGVDGQAAQARDPAAPARSPSASITKTP